MNNLAITEYNDIRVLTTQQIAEAYGTDTKIVQKNFERNKERFIEGKHYISLQGEELKDFKANRQIDGNLKFAPVLFLWTEKGAFLHAKSLNTDAAWEVYERLVDSYFNKKKVLSTAEQIQILAKGNMELEHKIDSVDKDLQDFKQELPLLGVDMDEITHAVRKRGIDALGGKDSPAYHDAAIRGQVYSDIYRELKHQFNCRSYKALRRNQLEQALAIIEEYELPIFLQDQIVGANAQMRLEV